MNNLDQVKTLLTEVIKLADGKVVININFFNTGDTDIKEIAQPAPIATAIADDPNVDWLSIPEAARTFGFSEIFFYNLAKQCPHFKKADNMQCFLNRDLVAKYLKEHPEHAKNRDRRDMKCGVEDKIQEAINILKQDRKEMYPDGTAPRSLRENYYTYKEIAEKLDCTYQFFNIRIRPTLKARLAKDAEYLKMLEEKGVEKWTYDEMIDQAVDILDREGKAFKSYSGHRNDADNYMGAKELAEKLGIAYHVFNSKIKPALEGKIYDRRHEGVKEKIESWKSRELAKV